MKLLNVFLLCTAAFAQSSTADRVLGALSDRALAEKVSGMSTDDRIAMYSLMVKTKPDDLHYQVLLAGGYIQKTRETTDYSYMDRAASILDGVISADNARYEARRLLIETQLERHMFAKAAESSRRLIQMDGADPWNWGTLGDALTEIGEYNEAAEAYQKMVTLRPDLASYNRAAHFHFLFNDVAGAIEIMKKAIESGSSSPENVAWCMVDLGNIYFKTGQTKEAAEWFTNAQRTFRGYHPAYAGLARTQAETGDLKAAIENYKRAQEITPLPDYAAALFDLYKKTGQDTLAKKQMDLLDAIDRVSRATGETANRNLVLAFADHDMKLDRALQLARGELEFRRDIYTYDALAWALFKNHQYTEARQYMEKALVLKTPEPLFQRHAAAIADALEKASKVPAIEQLFDRKLSATQRAGACFELRGVKGAETLVAMTRAMEDPDLLSCAAENLRVAGAVAELGEALASKTEQVRATAARLLGSFQNVDYLEPLSRAAADPNILVATNALAALTEYRGAAVMPYLAALAEKGGMIGDMALDRLAALDSTRALEVGRDLVASPQVPDKLYGMRMIAMYGDRGDLQALTKIASSGQEDLAQHNRGFGFMPPISLTRAAQTAIRAIESRNLIR
jgi:tetratricopeptide (TPR) repeat protein